MLSGADPLPFAPHRVLVAGVTGSGKTTLARRLGTTWALRHVEMDALFHGPQWTPRAQFLDDVQALASDDRRVTEWQYSSKGTDAILAPRADLVIWLDYPYRVVRARLLRRTASRSLLRTELWNGNREKPLWEVLRGAPEENILRWQTLTLRKWHERMPRVATAYPDLTIVRLGHPRETERWIRNLPRS